jgi:hypothetical protein
MKRAPLCICAKEIAMITGRSLRTAERLMNDMRFFFSKEKHQFITIREFCEYCGLDYGEVISVYF